jgi:hypothetical protein
MHSLFRNLLEKSSKSRDMRDESLVRKTTIYAKTALLKYVCNCKQDAPSCRRHNKHTCNNAPHWTYTTRFSPLNGLFSGLASYKFSSIYFLASSGEANGFTKVICLLSYEAAFSHKKSRITARNPAQLSVLSFRCSKRALCQLAFEHEECIAVLVDPAQLLDQSVKHRFFLNLLFDEPF